MNKTQIVYIVDDDKRVRDAIDELLTSYGIYSISFASAVEYIEAEKPDIPSCLVLDIELPDINGLELQEQIYNSQHPSIVFITGHGDISRSVKAMKYGAIDFLTKPFNEDKFMSAIDTALAKDRHRRLKQAELNELQRRYCSLTLREQQVLPLVVSGLLNKQAAAELGIREVTLQLHRRNIMRKMSATTFADLVRISEKLNIPIKHIRSISGKRS